MSEIIKTQSFQLAIYAKGDPDAKNFVLVLPGKLDTKDYAHMRSHVDFLAKKGFFAVSFDPPGTWKSPGDISLYTMSNYLKAVNELIVYYGNRSTFIMGHSRGATISLLAMLRNQYVLGCIAIFCSYKKEGFSTKPDMAWREKGMHISVRDLPYGDSEEVIQFALPYSFYEDQMQYNFTAELKNSTKPKLFIYGTYDELAKPEIVQGTFAIAGEPKQLAKIESDHDYRFYPGIITEINNLTERFLKDYLPELV